MTSSTATLEATVRKGFDEVAALLEYPQRRLADAVDRAVSAMGEACPGGAARLLPLREFADTADLNASQELFVRTFELNPVCALEIGWQMYGERYARGTFLVRMRELMRQVGLPETSELADHLANVLRVAARADDATAAKLARSFALPSLVKMRAEFAPGKDGERNPYASVLDAAADLLALLAPEIPEERPDE